MLSRKGQCKWRCRLMPFQIAFILLHHLVISVNLHLYDLKLLFHILHKSLISLCLVAIFTYTKEGTRGCLNQHITHTHKHTPKCLGAHFYTQFTTHPFICSFEKLRRSATLGKLQTSAMVWTHHPCAGCVLIAVCVTIQVVCWPLCVSVLRSPCELLVDHCVSLYELFADCFVCHCLSCVLTAVSLFGLCADSCVTVWVVCWPLHVSLSYFLTTLCHCIFTCWPLCVTVCLLADHFVSQYMFLADHYVSLYALLADHCLCHCLSCLLTGLCVTVHWLLTGL